MKNEIKKIKVSVSFQNAFADMIYNRVQHQEFQWINKIRQKGVDITKDEVDDLIEHIDNAIYETIKTFFDNEAHYYGYNALTSKTTNGKEKKNESSND